MKKTLYLGLDPSRYPDLVTHYPIIEIQERKNLQPYFDQLHLFDYVIFTSRTAVNICNKYTQIKKRCIAVGRATAELALECGFIVEHVAREERAEGVLEILRGLDASFFFPHSSAARPLLLDYLRGREAYFFPAYDTVTTKVRIDWSSFDAFVFTSPSCVKSFIELYGSLPKGEKIAIGPITAEALSSYQTPAIMTQMP